MLRLCTKTYRRTKEVGSIWHLVSSLSRVEMQGIYFWKIRTLPFDSKHIALVLQFVCPLAPADRPQQLGSQPRGALERGCGATTIPMPLNSATALIKTSAGPCFWLSASRCLYRHFCLPENL